MSRVNKNYPGLLRKEAFLRDQIDARGSRRGEEEHGIAFVFI